MLKFKNVEIGDRDWVKHILSGYPCKSLEYNFTTLFIWQKIYNTKIAEKDGFLFSVSGKKADKMSFLFPAGGKDIKKAVEELEAFCRESGMAMNFHSLNREQAEWLKQFYPEKFEFIQARDAGDYVYTAESLKTLKGKKLSSKRNHINRFIQNNPDWVYENMNESNINEALKMHEKWCDLAECDEEPGLADESCAVRRAFKYFNELCLSGGVLRAGGKVAAFSMGDPLNKNTFLVHIEKAYADIQGAYPMINKQFVIHNCDGYEFVNREEDTGDEGLRKAKLSYQPYEIIEKFNAREILL